MRLRPGRSLAAAAVAAASVTALGVATASAAPAATAAKSAASTSSALKPLGGGYPLHVKTLTTDVVGPLQIAVGPQKSVYVADDFAGVVVRIGDKKPVFTPPQGCEIGGVDVGRDGRVAVTWGNVEQHKSGLTVLRHGKKVSRRPRLRRAEVQPGQEEPVRRR